MTPATGKGRYGRAALDALAAPANRRTISPAGSISRTPPPEAEPDREAAFALSVGLEKDPEPPLTRLAVFAPSGAALLTQTVWLIDDEGRWGRLRVNPFTGVAFWSSDGGEEPEQESESEPESEPEPEPEPEAAPAAGEDGPMDGGPDVPGGEPPVTSSERHSAGSREAAGSRPRRWDRRGWNHPPRCRRSDPAS